MRFHGWALICSHQCPDKKRDQDPVSNRGTATGGHGMDGIYAARRDTVGAISSAHALFLDFSPLEM